jgi:hypothetical protein
MESVSVMTTIPASIAVSVCARTTARILTMKSLAKQKSTAFVLTCIRKSFASVTGTKRELEMTARFFTALMNVQCMASAYKANVNALTTIQVLTAQYLPILWFKRRFKELQK